VHDFFRVVPAFQIVHSWAAIALMPDRNAKTHSIAPVSRIRGGRTPNAARRVVSDTGVPPVRVDYRAQRSRG
jgi:hypothetical protein